MYVARLYIFLILPKRARLRFVFECELSSIRSEINRAVIKKVDLYQMGVSDYEFVDSFCIICVEIFF